MQLLHLGYSSIAVKMWKKYLVMQLFIEKFTEPPCYQTSSEHL